MLARRTHVALKTGRWRLWAGLFATVVLIIVQTAETQSPPTLTGSLTTVGLSGTAYDYPAISADGRYVAFLSELRLDPFDVNVTSDIYVKDRLNNTTALVSRSDSGVTGNDRSTTPSISADGRFVAFASDATSLIGDSDTNGTTDIFVQDRDVDGNGVFDEPGGTRLRRASVSSDGTESNCQSARPSISGNGQFVAFDSCATNWHEVDGKLQALQDIFVHDLQTGTTTWANPPTQGSTNGFNDHHSGNASLSTDGCAVAFESLASTQPVAFNQPGSAQIYVRNVCVGITEWASPQIPVLVDGIGQPTDAFKPSISAGGRFVAYEARAVSLVPGDTNNVADIFVFDRQTRSVRRVNVSSLGEQATTTGPSTCSGSLHAAINRDGRFVTFESCANNLVADDTAPPNIQDVFVHDRDADANGVFDEPGGIATALISRTSAGVTAGSSSLHSGISADGRVVVFSSFAQDLVTDPIVGSIGLYAWTVANGPPVADAGPNQTVVAASADGTEVLLDGTASRDPDGDALTFTWTGPFGTLTGAEIAPIMYVGSHTITLTVDDGRGGVSDTVEVVIAEAADLSLTASGEPDPVDVGGQIIYRLTVRNNGPAAATDVVASIELPASVDFVRASAPCTRPPAGTAGTVTCQLDSLVSGDFDTLVIIVTANVAGSLTVVPSARARQLDADVANNSASVTVMVGTLEPAVINIMETIAVTDTPGVRPSALLNISEQIVVQDALNVLPSAMLFINEAVTVTDLPAPRPSAMLFVTETVTVSDAPQTTLSPINTVLGMNVVVLPMDGSTGLAPVTMTFANVTLPGQTSLQIGAAGPLPPAGFVQGSPSLYYDLTTTAAFTGLVQVCVTYTGTSFPAAPLLWHYEAGVWVDITTVRDAANQVVCGDSRTLSPFALFAPANRSPSLTLPPAVVAEATSAAGASVTYTVTAHDPEDGPLTPACVPPSGAAFPLGATTVRCTVVDSAGASSQGDFAVTVRDTIAPQITVPAGQSALQTSAAGAIVHYPAPVIIENGSGLFSSGCQPASGSMFGVGTTTVTCTATDRSGNTNSAAFTVTVTALTAPNGRMHGAGHVDSGNRRHDFAFQVSQFGRHEDGRLEYRVNDAKQKPAGRFEATSVTEVTFSDDPGFRPGFQGRKPSVDSVSFAGRGEWNGRSGYTFVVIATDRGEPGRGRDTFSLVVRDSRGTSVASVSGALDGGNIQSTRLGR